MEKNVLAPATTRAAKARAKDDRLEYSELIFPQGLIGCPDWQHFRLYPEPFEACGELVCLDEPGIGLMVADPAWLHVNYNFELDDDDVEALELASADDARVLCTLMLHRTPALITANLAGPLIVNWSLRRGRQVILDHLAYPLRAPVIAGEAAHALILALTGAERDSTEAVSPSEPSANAPNKGA
jgi:flagellar assembly factor FliW